MSAQSNDFGFIPFNTEKEIDISQNANEFGFIPYQEPGFSNIALEGVKGLGRIAGRSAASLLAAPSKAIGGGLEFIGGVIPKSSETGPQNPLPVLLKNIGQYLQKTGKGGEEYLKGQIENLLGESYGSLEESLSRFGERVGDIYGRGPFKGMGLPSVAGGISGQVAQELGASPEVQSISELAGVLTPDTIRGAASLIPQAIKEKSGLVLPRIVEKTKEGLRYLKPKVFEGKKEEAYKNVSNQADKLIKNIQREKMPLTKQIEEGIDVESRLYNELDEVTKIAKELPNKIESNFISDYLNRVESKIKEIPVPSQEQEKILNLVEKYRKEYGQGESGMRFYSPEQFLKQFRNINKNDIKNLIDTKFLQGEQLETLGFYRGLNEEIAKTLEHGTPKSFSDLFRQTNKEFSELSNINRFEAIVDSFTTNGVIDANKLQKTLGNSKKSKMIKRQLGNDGFENLQSISKDLVKVKDKLKFVDEFGLKDVVKSTIAHGILSKLGIPFAAPIQAGKKALEFADGYMLLNSKGFRDTENFLKSLQSGSKKSIETYLRRLDKNAQEYEDSINPSK